MKQGSHRKTFYCSFLNLREGEKKKRTGENRIPFKCHYFRNGILLTIVQLESIYKKKKVLACQKLINITDPFSQHFQKQKRKPRKEAIIKHHSNKRRVSKRVRVKCFHIQITMLHLLHIPA